MLQGKADASQNPNVLAALMQKVPNHRSQLDHPHYLKLLKTTALTEYTNECWQGSKAVTGPFRQWTRCGLGHLLCHFNCQEPQRRGCVTLSWHLQLVSVQFVLLYCFPTWQTYFKSDLFQFYISTSSLPLSRRIKGHHVRVWLLTVPCSQLEFGWCTNQTWTTNPRQAPGYWIAREASWWWWVGKCNLELTGTTFPGSFRILSVTGEEMSTCH